MSLALVLALAVTSPAALLLPPIPDALAADTTDVASSFDKDNVFDLNLRVGYEYSTKTAAVKREHEGIPGQTSVLVLKDLLYKQQRSAMNLRAEIGLYQDLALSLEMPLVLSDNRSLEYDQRKGGECVFAGRDANCVNADNSLSTNSEKDGSHPTTPDYMDPNFILPVGGYDATRSSKDTPIGFPTGSSMVFRGPQRGGSGGAMLDTLNFALSWAVLSQRRDDTKPTWVIALAYHLSIGDVMRFDRANPDANHAIADGLDHVVAKTAVSHRFKYADPYVVFWFDYPFARRSDTQFVNLGGNAKNAFAQMSAGTRFGFEGVPYENVKSGYKISIDLNGRIQGKFDGRGYSEIWEMLASSPALACDPAWNPSCMLPSSPYAGRPYSGITTIENFVTLGAEAALVLQLTRYVRFRAWFLYQHDQTHLVTIDDVGTPGAVGMRVGLAEEYNPAFRPVINEIGRRYKVDDVDMYSGGVWGQVMF